MAYSECAMISRAAEAAGVTATTTWYWRNGGASDEAREKFNVAFAIAHQMAVERLEDEATRRAMHGVQKLKFYQGVPIEIPLIGEDGRPERDEKGNVIMVPYVEHEYSDMLIMARLNAELSEKYRHRTDQKVSGNIDMSHSGEVGVRVLQDDDWYSNVAQEPGEDPEAADDHPAKAIPPSGEDPR